MWYEFCKLAKVELAEFCSAHRATIRGAVSKGIEIQFEQGSSIWELKDFVQAFKQDRLVLPLLVVKLAYFIRGDIDKEIANWCIRRFQSFTCEVNVETIQDLLLSSPFHITQEGLVCSLPIGSEPKIVEIGKIAPLIKVEGSSEITSITVYYSSELMAFLTERLEEK